MYLEKPHVIYICNGEGITMIRIFDVYVGHLFYNKLFYAYNYICSDRFL